MKINKYKYPNSKINKFEQFSYSQALHVIDDIPLHVIIFLIPPLAREARYPPLSGQSRLHHFSQSGDLQVLGQDLDTS